MKHLTACILFLLYFLNGADLHAQHPLLQEWVNNKQFQAVINYADSLTSTDSTDYATLSAVGQAYEGMLRYKEAYRMFQQCLRLDSTNVDAMNAVARNALGFGKIAEAKRFYQQVLAIDSMNFYANHQLARLYYQLEDYGKATEFYHNLLFMEKENPTILIGLADCQVKRGTAPNILIGISLYSRALELNPENVRAASSLIHTLLRLGDAEKALQVCDTAIFYNPDHKSLRQSRGMALYMLKAYDQANTMYSSLLAEGDSTFLNLKYAGASRYMFGHILDGVDLLAKAYEMDTTDIETMLLYGASLGKTYDRKRAYALFDRAEKAMQPQPFFVHLLTSFRGDVLKRDGRWDEAEKLYYAAWKKEPDQLAFLYEISQHYWDKDPDLFKNERKLQKALFGKYTYLTAILQTDKYRQNLYHYRYFLQKVYEYVFFRNLENIPMRSPDGKQSTIPVAELRALIERLPESPDHP